MKVTYSKSLKGKITRVFLKNAILVYVCLQFGERKGREGMF